MEVSHQVPVQTLVLHLAHQVHQATLEEDLKAQVVFDHQGGAKATLHNLKAGVADEADCEKKRLGSEFFTSFQML